MAIDNVEVSDTSIYTMQMHSVAGNRFDSRKSDKHSLLIHSGHFMHSRVHEEKDEDDDDGDPEHNFIPGNPGNSFIRGRRDVSHDNNTGSTGDSFLSIDESLSKMLECMSLAYSGKITSPKWKAFRGLRLTAKDRVRLNNIIWREWHMQYIFQKQSVVCQFATPLSDHIHSKPEAVVLEGKYWKRRLDTVTKEYKKWRRYYRDRFLQTVPRSTIHMSEYELLERVKEISIMRGSVQQYSTDLNLLSADLSDMDFGDELLNFRESLPSPSSGEMSPWMYANMIQPGLGQLQPSLEDFMEIDALQEFQTTVKAPTINQFQPQSSNPHLPDTGSTIDLSHLQPDPQNETSQSILGLLDPTPVHNFSGHTMDSSSMLTMLTTPDSHHSHVHSAEVQTPAGSAMPEKISFPSYSSQTDMLFDEGVASKQAEYSSEGFPHFGFVTQPSAMCVSQTPLTSSHLQAGRISHHTAVSPQAINFPQSMNSPQTLNSHGTINFPRAINSPKTINFPQAISSPETINFRQAINSHEAINFPQTMNSPQAINSPKTINFPQAINSPETVNFHQAMNSPEAVNFPQAIHSPEAVNFPQAIHSPEAVNFPQTMNSPEAVNFRQAINSPEAVKFLQLIKPFQAKKSPQALNSPQTVQTRDRPGSKLTPSQCLPLTAYLLHRAMSVPGASSQSTRSVHTGQATAATEQAAKVSRRRSSPSQTAMHHGSTSSFSVSSSAKKDSFVVPQGKPVVPKKPRSTTPSPSSTTASSTCSPLASQNSFLVQLLTQGVYSGGISNVKQESVSREAAAPKTKHSPLLSALSTSKPRPPNASAASSLRQLSPASASSQSSPRLSATPPHSPSPVAPARNAEGPSVGSLLFSLKDTLLLSSDKSGAKQRRVSTDSTGSESFSAMALSPAQNASFPPSSPLANPFVDDVLLLHDSSSDSVLFTTRTSDSDARDRQERGLSSDYSPSTSDLPGVTAGVGIHMEQRRAVHLSAEQKRRFNLKSGFGLLYKLVPSLVSKPKVSKANMLQKTAEHIRKMKMDRIHMQQEAAILTAEIEKLNEEISQVQLQLPETGTPVTRQRVDHMKDMFDNYVSCRTLQNWKFWIFSIIIQDLFNSYNNMVSTASFRELYRTTCAWHDQHCSLVSLRPIALNALTQLSKTTSILTKPEQLREQAIQAVSKGSKGKGKGGKPRSSTES